MDHLHPTTLRWLCIGIVLMAIPTLVSLNPHPVTPTPPPAPGPAPAPQPQPSRECVCCNGAGWVGDGGQGDDCGCCDSNGDGSYVDPLPPGIRPSPASINPNDLELHLEAEYPKPEPPHEPEPEAPPEPVNFFKDIKEEAYVLAEQNGLGVLVLVSPNTSDPKTCEPCELFQSAIQRDFETRGAKSPFMDWVGWKVYQGEADHGKAISSLTKFPYVYLTTIGEADEEGVHTPEVLWHGHVRYPQDFDRFLKVLEKLSSNNRSEK